MQHAFGGETALRNLYGAERILTKINKFRVHQQSCCDLYAEALFVIFSYQQRKK